MKEVSRAVSLRAYQNNLTTENEYEESPRSRGANSPPFTQVSDPGSALRKKSMDGLLSRIANQGLDEGRGVAQSIITGGKLALDASLSKALKADTANYKIKSYRDSNEVVMTKEGIDEKGLKQQHSMDALPEDDSASFHRSIHKVYAGSLNSGSN